MVRVDIARVNDYDSLSRLRAPHEQHEPKGIQSPHRPEAVGPADGLFRPRGAVVPAVFARTSRCRSGGWN